MKLSEKITDKAIETVLEAVSGWYGWCLENVDKKGTKIIETKVGKLSSKHLTVQIVTEDVNGNRYNVYITPEPFFVKGHIKGKTYRFKKDFMSSMDSYLIED